MAWLNAGKRIVPIGSSDSHEVARKLVGQGRTYVRCDDADPGAIDVEAAVRSFVDGKVIVSLGLFANIKVNGKAGPGDQVSPEKDDVIVEGEVQGPGWAKATRLSLFLNGERIRTFDVLDDQQSRAGVKARVRWVIPRPLHDGHLSVVAEGPGNTGPHFVIAKAYQPRSKTWRPFLLSVTGAVWLDADRDGRWSSPRQTAARLLNSHRNDRKRLLQELARHDVAVVGQAAHLLAEGGVTLLDEQLSALVGESQPVVKKGFEAYFAAWRISQQARAQ
jgi:hypothetical protein